MFAGYECTGLDRLLTSLQVSAYPLCAGQFSYFTFPCVLTVVDNELLQGARENFEVYYRKQRKKQARLALQPPANMVGSLS